jgi:hypothetical protein
LNALQCLLPFVFDRIRDTQEELVTADQFSSSPAFYELVVMYGDDSTSKFVICKNRPES